MRLTRQDYEADLRMHERDLRRALMVRNRSRGWFGSYWARRFRVRSLVRTVRASRQALGLRQRGQLELFT